MSVALIFAALVCIAAIGRIETLVAAPGAPVLKSWHWFSFVFCFVLWCVVTSRHPLTGLAAAVASWPLARWMLTDYTNRFSAEHRAAAMQGIIDPLAIAAMVLALIAPWHSWITLWRFARHQLV